MRKILLPCSILAAVVALASPASAQATRTWVSGVGDDVNPCSRTAPCKTYAGAISKTAKDGEISTLDPGGFGGVTITKSITINGTPGSGYGSILAAGANGVIINITDPADVRKAVRLNWLDINGASTGIRGVSIIAASSVTIENTVIDGFVTTAVSDTRSGGGKLNILNTSIRNNTGQGILIAPSSGAVKISANLNNVNVSNSSFGLSVGSAARVSVDNSTFTGNGSGIEAEGPNGGSEVNVDRSTVSNNTTGIQTFTGGTIRLSNTNISFNGTGISSSGGSVLSFTNNRLSSNGAGSAITPIGSPTSDSGQQ